MLSYIPPSYVHIKDFFKALRKDITDPLVFTTTSLDKGVNTQNPKDAGTEANLDTQYTVRDDYFLNIRC